MAITEGRRFWSGSAIDDIISYLQQYSAFKISKAILLLCDKCGCSSYGLEYDEDEGVAKVVCLHCGEVSYILDGEEYISEATLSKAKCTICGNRQFNIGVGLILRDNSSIKWVYIAERCTKCTTLGSHVDWKVNYDLVEPEGEFFHDFIEIQRLCGQGSEYAEVGKLVEAIQCYEEALQLLPEPKEQWESGTRLYSSLGDAQFKQGAYPEAIDNLEISQKCPGGASDPFITLRLGQCYYEIGDRKKAEELLLQTFDVGGPDYFEHEDPKYFELIAHLPY